MERLDVKGLSLAGLDLVAQLEPEPLADFVRRCLTRPAEVAIELETQEALGHVGVVLQELPGLVIGPVATAELCGGLEAAVDPNIEDDACRTQRLAVEQAHAVARVVHVAQLCHQSLGVERPALTVARCPGVHAPPAVESLGPVHRLSDLEMMAGDALVVDGRQLAPGTELGEALGHRPPHPTRTAEVLGRPCVVDAAHLGRGDHALDGTYRLGDVEVRAGQVGDDLVGLALHPRLELIGAVQLVSGVGIQDGDGLLDGGAGLDLLGHGLHLVGDTGQFLLPPRIGLLEIDGGAQESP